MDIEYYVGGIALFPYNFVPSGWMTCDGQILQINQYQALYSLIGNTFGGSPNTTFALPNLNGVPNQASAAPLPTMRYYIAVTGIYPTRE